MNLKHFPLSLLAVCTGFALSGCDTQPKERVGETKQPVQVVQLQQHQKQQLQQFTGRVSSAKSAAIAFRVPGLIHEILVQPGQAVSKGQVLARLDPHDYQVTVRELKARLSEAKSAHKLAAIEFDRVKQAVNDDAMSTVSLDRAKSGFERSKAQVDVTKQNLQRAQDLLRYSELKAPFDGVIATNNFEAFEQVIPGASVMTIQTLDNLEVEIDVPENLIAYFEKGQMAQVSWHGFNEPLMASVIEKETLPDLIKQTYKVTYKIDSIAGLAEPILPGKSVTLTAAFQSNDDTYCVPYSSVLGNEGGHFVFRVETDQNDHSNRVQSVDVNVEGFQAEKICVSGPLDSVDQIVVAGGSYLLTGDEVGQVRVRNKNGAEL